MAVFARCTLYPEGSKITFPTKRNQVQVWLDPLRVRGFRAAGRGEVYSMGEVRQGDVRKQNHALGHTGALFVCCC